jgi:putative toxin-antitoxin system antitoxin component (TIGR02293 family)
MATAHKVTISAALAKFQRYIENGTPPGHSYALLLGLRDLDWPHLLRTIEHGFTYDTFEHLRENAGLSFDETAEWLHLSARTLLRRKQQGRFAVDESDRLLRAARLLGRAIELFDGDNQAAHEWLLTPQPALGNETPVTVARTELGAREVENLIGRIEHGVFS